MRFLPFFFFLLAGWRGACSLISPPPPRERAHSLHYNGIGEEGARAVAEALKSNTTLTTLGCVSQHFFFFFFFLAGCAWCVSDHSFSLPRERAHSLWDNRIGEECARAFKEMFAFNGTLTTLYG